MLCLWIISGKLLSNRTRDLDLPIMVNRFNIRLSKWIVISLDFWTADSLQLRHWSPLHCNNYELKWIRDSNNDFGAKAFNRSLRAIKLIVLRVWTSNWSYCLSLSNISKNWTEWIWLEFVIHSKFWEWWRWSCMFWVRFHPVLISFCDDNPVFFMIKMQVHLESHPLVYEVNSLD